MFFTFVSVFAPFSWWFATVCFALISVFAVRVSVWAAVVILGDAFSIALLFIISTTDVIMWDTLLSLFTASFIVIAAAVFNALVVLGWAVEGWWVAAWLVSGPALSVALNLVVSTAEMV